MPPTRRVHQAQVVENRDAGRGYFRMVLRAPALASRAKPGHFVMLRVSENLDPLLARPFGIAIALNIFHFAGDLAQFLGQVQEGVRPGDLVPTALDIVGLQPGLVLSDVHVTLPVAGGAGARSGRST